MEQQFPRSTPGSETEGWTTMMYLTLTLMAGLISVMFVATAVSSVVNAVRESYAARDALSRRAAV
ncbi:MAG: hypothetical protein JWM58_294 [Rhizobium sp.]|nr:hypothetical protein [Rhizobium sp.]